MSLGVSLYKDLIEHNYQHHVYIVVADKIKFLSYKHHNTVLHYTLYLYLYGVLHDEKV